MGSSNNLVFPSSLIQSLFWKTAIFFSLLSSSSTSQPKSPVGIFTAIAPTTISPFSTYTIRIAVERTSKHEQSSLLPIQVSNETNGTTSTKTFTSESFLFDVEIKSGKETYRTVTPTQIRPESTGIISIQIRELTADEYILTITMKHALKPHPEISQATRIFPTKGNQDEPLILIHSDKPIYKPGDAVKFRIILLNKEAKPLISTTNSSVSLKITISNPQKKVVKTWNNAELNVGLFSSIFQLSSEPSLGTWVIQVRPTIKMISPTTNNSSETKTLSLGEKSYEFTVDQYVLPKFEVTLKLPPYLLFKTPNVLVGVDAKYTYGEGIKGECTLVVVVDNERTARSSEIEKTFPIQGTATTEIDLRDMFGTTESMSETEITFLAQVTETVTGKSMNASTSVHLYRLPYKIEYLENSQNDRVRAGLPFTVRYKITTQDNIPIHDPRPNAVKMAQGDIDHSYSFVLAEGDRNAEVFEASVPPNGIVAFTFTGRKLNYRYQKYTVVVKYKELKFSHVIQHSYSSDYYQESYINIKLLTKSNSKNSSAWEDLYLNTLKGNPTVKVNSHLMVNVISTDPFTSVNYVLQNVRSQTVLEFRKVNVKPKIPVKEYNFTIICPPDAFPEASIIVYVVIVRDGGDGTATRHQVAADSFKFNAAGPQVFLNYLNMSVPDRNAKTTFEPGQQLNLRIESKPNSLVAISGIDQSVLLLAASNAEITQAYVDQQLEKVNEEVDTSVNEYQIPTSFTKIFSQSGLSIISNADFENLWEERVEPMYDLAVNDYDYNWRPVAMLASIDDYPAETPVTPLVIKVRKEFPETWLWEEVTLNGSNSVTLSKIVPDTLTSWIISGYSLNTEFGLGVLPQPMKLTVFRPFFLSLNLPYSVVKGEILVLQVLVHNYLPTAPTNDQDNLNGNTTVEITLDNSKNQFRFNDNSLKDAKEHKKIISCRPNSVTSETFVIVPSEFGAILLNVKGIARNPSTMTLAGDALSQPLRVKPPGQQLRKTASTLIKGAPQNSSIDSSAQSSKLNVNFPSLRVPGADGVKISFVSDILGSTMANMDKLLQMPTGCGEQNMLNFVVDIVILEYLQSTHSLNQKVQTKALNFLEIGYQRELTYSHNDGSYSAFGKSDFEGSTWLTAFVVRSFIQASPFIPVDESVIDSALNFLSKQQARTGEVTENGRVLHSGMQGGSSSSGIILTAYTILAFIEATSIWNQKSLNTNTNEPSYNSGTDYTENIERGLNYITNSSKTNDAFMNEPYAAAIITYALHKANHSLKDLYFEKLLTLASRDGDLLFWEAPSKSGQSKEKITKPISVEMTGYALLTYIHRGEISESFPLVTWLLKERNSDGGFHSTQDTVVALTALAKFAELTKDKATNLQAKASCFTELNQTDILITIDENNADVLQEYELPKETRSVEIHASGTGSLLAQLTWTYYVEVGVKEPAFNVSVESLTTSAAEMELNLCTFYTKGYASNMAIFEINLPSGYSFDEADLSSMLVDVEGYKRLDMENGGTKADIYFDSITRDQTCFQVMAEMVYKVGKQAPAVVNVYDYYDTTESARAFYDAPAVDLCEICRENNNCLST